MNLSWVSSKLCVGGHVADEDLPRLKNELGIWHVVDVRLEQSDCPVRLRSLGLELLCLPTEDHHAINEHALERGVTWVCERLARDEAVYIHCHHGIGRSVMLTLCVLVKMGEPPRAALRRIKKARYCASPSPAQLEAFMRWYKRELGQEPPSFDELAYLAYHIPPSELHGTQLGSVSVES